MSQAQDHLEDKHAQPGANSPGSAPTPAPNAASGLSSSAVSQSVPFPVKPSGNSLHDESGPITSAAMPPAMANTKSYSADELLTLLNRTPLFMTELDETDGAGGENIELEAIKALAYEGTRAEVAMNFRVQGNEMVAAKHWTDAKEFYSKALSSLKLQPGERTDGGQGPAEVSWAESTDQVVDLEEEEKKEKAIEEACYVNRALCNLELKNYGSCNRDCAAAIRMNPRNIKAYYRSALACLSLDKLDAALDACIHALIIEPTNSATKTLETRIKKRQEILARLEAERQARLQRARAEKATLGHALAKRKITVRITADAPNAVEDAVLRLEDPLNADSLLYVPTLLLYPTAGQSDMVKAFAETQTLQDHLEYILPCPWDETGEFVLDDVECYMETAAGGLAKVGKKVALGKILAGGKMELTDAICRIFVIPKEKTSEWISEIKKRKGK